MKITAPTLLLDKQKCIENIRNMARKALLSNVSFRPHFKTHQSRTIGEWFRENGVRAITVSSVRMALYFAENGWNDITIAFPINPRELESIDLLAKRINLNILVVDPEAISCLESTITRPAGVFLKIDTGYHRTGIEFNDRDTILKAIEHLQRIPQVHFKGFLTHTGHTYKASTPAKIIALYEDTVKKLVELKTVVSSIYDQAILSIGDTPSCSLVGKFENIQEIRPGNFVFYDLMQYHLGSCSPDQIAVVVAVPVVARYRKRDELVVYGGAVHLSKEYITLPSGERSFGKIVELTENGWNTEDTGCFVSGLSQEHGIVKMNQALTSKIRIGDLIGIIPVHSCLTANLMRGYVTLEGEYVDHMEGYH